MGKTRKRVFFPLLFLILFIFLLSTPLAALAQDNGAVKRTVRVAFPVVAGLMDYDEYGNRTGYTYEYLEEIAQYTGWDYEFVEVEGDINERISKLMDMVEDGTIDLMGDTLFMEELNNIYDYSSYHYGQSETILQVLNEKVGEYVINSLVDQPFKIAVRNLSGSSFDELQVFCETNRISPEYILCESTEAQLEVLQNGSADMMLNKNMNYVPGVTTIASFAIKPFYFITTKGKNPELMDELNLALMSIAQSDPYFSTKLYEKYFGPEKGELYLTAAEKKYVAESKTFKVGVLKESPPYQYLENGEYKGIANDTLRLVAKKTGLKFEMVSFSTPEEIYEKAEKSEIDLVAGLPYNYELANQHNYAMSRPYISAQYLLLMRSGFNETDLKGKRLALTTSNTYNGPTLGNIKIYSTFNDCIKAVVKNEADYTYVDAYTAQYYINLPEYKKLKIVLQNYSPREVCFGVVKPVPTELLSILNKCITTFSEVETQGIINGNIIRATETSLADLIRENPVEAILILAGVFALIIGVLIFFLYRRAQRNRRSALELKKHFRVYALVNEYFFEYNFRTQQMVVSIPPEKVGDKPEIKEFDFSEAVIEREASLRKSAFLDVILSQKSGVRDAYLACVDGENHWLRFAIDTVFDGEKPAYVLGKINIIDDEKQKESDLLERASLDSLTHLYNTERFAELVRAGFDRELPGTEGALILLDVDLFKSINDSFGHMRGDEILVESARLLKNVFPENAVVGRPGGDEFSVYLPNIESREHVKKLCERIRGRANRIVIGESRRLSFSIGVAFTKAGEEYDSLYRRADAALYRAKEKGRNCFEVEDE